MPTRDDIADWPTIPPICAICETPIPTARLEVSPRTKTCSRKCSRELAKRNSRRASRAFRDRERARKS